MTVKTIFKVLIGTIAIMVIGSLVIEWMNMTVVSLQLTSMSKLASRQAAVLFSQETYKERTDGALAGGSVNMDDVVNADGGTYVEGSFYGNGKTAEQIYTGLYTSSDFRSWLDIHNPTGNWKSIELIDKALNHSGSLTLTPPSNLMAPGFAAQMDAYTESMLAMSYKEVMMTPLNMGVPYLDEDVLEKMFKWNLAQLASDCNSAAIRQDDRGNYCVYYKGYRVYASQATITNLDYRIYDLDDMGQAQDFQEVTHIDPDNLGFDDSLIQYLGHMADGDERQRICIVGIEFSVPVAYEGVTPIRNLAEFAWNTEVEGLDGVQDNESVGMRWNDTTADLNSGGFAEANIAAGVLPVPGKLIYYVVR